MSGPRPIRRISPLCTTCFYRPDRMWESDDLHLGTMGKELQTASSGTRTWIPLLLLIRSSGCRGNLQLTAAPCSGVRSGVPSPEARGTHSFPVKQACEGHFSETESSVGGGGRTPSTHVSELVWNLAIVVASLLIRRDCAVWVCRCSFSFPTWLLSPASLLV